MDTARKIFVSQAYCVADDDAETAADDSALDVAVGAAADVDDAAAGAAAGAVSTAFDVSTLLEGVEVHASRRLPAGWLRGLLCGPRGAG